MTMNSDKFDSRLKLLYGDSNVDKLKDKKILIFGLGGVGGYVLETLARSNIKHFKLVDADCFTPSNLNRQVLATLDTIGKKKVDVAKERCLSIQSDIDVETYDLFYLNHEEHLYLFEDVDFVIDCIDTTSAKIDIIEYCVNHNIPVISSMGTGNKKDPTKLVLCDLSKTSMCPLAKVLRRELKKRNILHVPVCYSTEKPIENTSGTIASSHVVPPVAGIMLASYVLEKLMEENNGL